ncbi:hypothetical protein SDC9_132756 [bioreactor metagenome]|uniref:Uncharacterized protein n=1 Tax=bioreactor metagenome TaxID=1076179 RepID=A0A645D8Z6_9ZZZZ
MPRAGSVCLRDFEDFVLIRLAELFGFHGGRCANVDELRTVEHLARTVELIGRQAGIDVDVHAVDVARTGARFYSVPFGKHIRFQNLYNRAFVQPRDQLAVVGGGFSERDIIANDHAGGHAERARILKWHRGA